MNRRRSRPPTFIATPCSPVGRPKRNSDRMIVQSGRQRHAPREPDRRALGEQQPEPDDAGGDAAGHRADRRAEDAEARERPGAGDQRDVEREVHHRQADAEIERGARVAGRAQRPAQHEEQQHAQAAGEHQPQVGQRDRLHLRRGAGQIQQPRRGDVADRREHAERQEDRGEEGLVDDAVHRVGVTGAGVPRHQHAHAGVERADEDDDDQEDLPADPDGRVAGEADHLADHRVIDDALRAADRVLQHRRPREVPHGRRQRAIDDAAIEALL